MLTAKWMAKARPCAHSILGWRYSLVWCVHRYYIILCRGGPGCGLIELEVELDWNGVAWSRVKSSQISFISCELREFFSNCYPICNLNFTVECLNCIFVSLYLRSLPLALASNWIQSFPISPLRGGWNVKQKVKLTAENEKRGKCVCARAFSIHSFRCVSCINKGQGLSLSLWLIAPTCLAVSCLTLRQFSPCIFRLRVFPSSWPHSQPKKKKIRHKKNNKLVNKLVEKPGLMRVCNNKCLTNMIWGLSAVRNCKMKLLYGFHWQLSH